jgi:hypothetical protein
MAQNGKAITMGKGVMILSTLGLKNARLVASPRGFGTALQYKRGIGRDANCSHSVGNRREITGDRVDENVEVRGIEYFHFFDLDSTKASQGKRCILVEEIGP